jgi:hypothetical protein
VLATAAVAIAIAGCGTNGSGTTSHESLPNAARTRATKPPSTQTPTVTESPTPRCRRHHRAPLVIHDRPNDVDHTNSVGEAINAPGPHPRADLLRVVVTNGCPNVKVVEHIADLQPHGYQDLNLQFLTPRREYDVTTTLFHVHNARAAPLRLYLFALGHSADRRVRCPGKSGRADFTRNVLTFVIPRTCMADPAWVQILINITDGDPDYKDYEDMLDPAAIKPDGYSPRAYR